MSGKKVTKRKVTGFAPVLAFLKDTYLSADPRWLGVFRIALGTLLVVDVSRRWMDARMFYSNDGILPNHYSIYRPMGRDVFSLFHAFSTVGEVSVAFALSLVVCVLFLVGYKTKLFHVLAALVITSLNARNIFVENGGTVVVNLLTIWTLFLPLGHRFSVDAVVASLRAYPEHSSPDLNDRTTPPRTTERAVSIAVLGLMLQWAIIYYFNAVTKTGVGWRDGTALHWFWHQDRIVTAFGVWARDAIPLWAVKAGTYWTLVMEHALPVLILSPILRTWSRRLAFLCAIGLHGGIAASSRLGPFSYVMTIYFFLLLGEKDWAVATRWFGRSSRARTVIYDSDCGVCLLICRILKRIDPFERLTFVGNHEREKIDDGIDEATLSRTVVVVGAEKEIYTEERAVFEAVKALPFGILLVFWLRVPGLATVGRRAYRRVAERRMDLSAWLGLGICGAPALAGVPTGVPTAPGEAAVRRDGEEEGGEGDGEGGGEGEGEGEGDGEPPLDPLDPCASPFKRELKSALVVLREGAAAVLFVALATQAAIENRPLAKLVKVKQPSWMRKIVDVPRIYQGWRMFAPEPPYDDGRVVVDGRTVDGREVDPFTGQEPDFDPYTETGWMHDQFMCDYHNRIRFPGHTGNRQHLRDYLRKYHEVTGNPNDRLVAFDAWWVHDKSPPPGVKRGEPMPPQKLISFGRVPDSGATPWLKPDASLPARRPTRPAIPAARSPRPRGSE